MPLITIEMLPGRTKETKAKLAEAVADTVCKVGGSSREHCWVIFHETDADSWSIGGNLLSSDAFKEKVNAYKDRVNKDE